MQAVSLGGEPREPQQGMQKEAGRGGSREACPFKPGATMGNRSSTPLGASGTVDRGPVIPPMGEGAGALIHQLASVVGLEGP